MFLRVESQSGRGIYNGRRRETSGRQTAAQINMTYCLAIKIRKGLVFASDSRTNAGMDYVTTYGKMHTFTWPGDRTLCILTAGNLATTQAVLNRVQQDLEDDGADTDLRQADHMFVIARYVGLISQSVQQQHAEVM
jgi:putative proteasome-type protease